ncbi:MAG: hypothetical protein PHX08_01105 [Lachnospiraceae bacterium]|nr:hypothetical protein [Lachnospiraceae bacterium]
MKRIQTKRWCTGSTEEYFDSTYNSKEEAIECGKEECNGSSFWIGKVEGIEIEKTDCGDLANYAIEAIAYNLNEVAGESSESFDPTKEEELALQNMLEDTVELWLMEKDIKAGCYAVTDIECIEKE